MFNLKKKSEKIDPKQIKKGIEVEMEHTDDKEIAEKIAMDHLNEDPRYYVFLESMEKLMKETKSAKNGVNMNKISKIIQSHLNGEKTKQSKLIMSKISKKLKENGLKPPFKIKISQDEKIYNKNRLDQTTRGVLNRELGELTTPGNKTRYFPAIPLQDIINILAAQGLIILQEDNTEWDGLLLGRDESVHFDIAPVDSAQKQEWGTTYTPISNAQLILQWYKMDQTGNYEINTYIS
jgi:hypothetical protein